MKISLMLLTSLAAFTLTATAQPADTRLESTQAQIKITGTNQPIQLAPVPKSHKVTTEGIAVKAAKSRNPLQLINPWAPKEYGSGETNVVNDPTSGTPKALKIFAISW